MNHCFEICHYQQNVPQHYYLLDTLVYSYVLFGVFRSKLALAYKINFHLVLIFCLCSQCETLVNCVTERRWLLTLDSWPSVVLCYAIGLWEYVYSWLCAGILIHRIPTRDSTVTLDNRDCKGPFDIFVGLFRYRARQQSTKRNYTFFIFWVGT